MATARAMYIVRISATSSAAEPVVFRDELVKLIDVSKCIGCKACQAACDEWNDLRADIGTNTGSLQNPPDLAADTWTLMRFSEYENPRTGDLEWLIRKDGCMH